MLVCRDPRGTHRRVWVSRRSGSSDSIGGARKCEGDDADEEVDAVVEEAYPTTLAKRIPWVLTLLVSLRLTGWKIGEPSHDRRQPPARMSRSAYFMRAISIAVQSYLLLDAAAFYVQTDPFFTTSGMGIDHPFPPPSAETPSWIVMLRLLPPRLVRCSMIAAQSYGAVTNMFYPPLTFMVGLNAVGLLPNEWSPHTWPLPFGHFSAIPERGLRGLWGSWWHGVNRQVTATPGRWLTQISGIPTKSLTGYALLTISAFFFSGVMHMGLVPPEPEASQMSAGWIRLYVGGFFWAQILAFGFELAASKFVARFIPQALNWSVTKALVTAYTAAWLCLTLPLLAVAFQELRYWHIYPVPVSLLQGLSGKGWWTW